MTVSLLHALIIASTVGAASGAIGAFIILKRMALVGDALSHVALPGIAVALAYHIDPFWGVAAFLVGAAFLVFWLEKKTTLPSEALVGLLFTTSLAIGIIAIPDTEILESLFGSFPVLPMYLLGTVSVSAIAAAVLVFFCAKKFAFRAVSSELAEASGVGRSFDLFFLVLFAVIVALGIKLVGTLLMGALTIIPASIAKNITKSLKSYVALSTFFGAAIAFAGALIARFFHLLPGPTIVLFGIMIFLGSLFFARK